MASGQQGFWEAEAIKRIKAHLDHCLNPLHLYCLLRRIGLRKGLSLGIVRTYERYFFFMWPAG